MRPPDPSSSAASKNDNRARSPASDDPGAANSASHAHCASPPGLSGAILPLAHLIDGGTSLIVDGFVEIRCNPEHRRNTRDDHARGLAGVPAGGVAGGRAFTMGFVDNHHQRVFRIVEREGRSEDVEVFALRIAAVLDLFGRTGLAAGAVALCRAFHDAARTLEGVEAHQFTDVEAGLRRDELLRHGRDLLRRPRL